MSLLLLFQPVAGGTDGTANLTGVSSALSAGTITATGEAAASITGATSSAAAGTITATGQATASLTGATSTVSAGTIVATGDASAVMSGAGAEFSAGAITATGDGSVAVNGQTVTVTAGEIVGSGDQATESVGVGWLWFNPRPAKRNGTAKLTGASCKLHAGRITASGSATAITRSSFVATQPGLMRAQGIQNPTDEQLLAALELLEN